MNILYLTKLGVPLWLQETYDPGHL